MKKNSWLLYLLASGLILASCNKDNLPAPESKKTPTEKSQGGTADQPQDPPPFRGHVLLTIRSSAENQYKEDQAG